MKRPDYTIVVSDVTPGIQIVTFTTGRKWAIIPDAELREGFKKASSNLGAMGTTAECLARANWCGSLAYILQVHFVQTNSEWETYLKREADAARRNADDEDG